VSALRIGPTKKDVPASFKPRRLLCPDKCARDRGPLELVGVRGRSPLQSSSASRRIRIFHLEPIGKAPRAVRRVLALAHDAFEPELAGVSEHRTVSRSEIDHFVMAITAAEAMVRYVAPGLGAELHGRTQMRKTTLLAVVAAVTAIGLGVWAAAPTNARVPSTSQGIEPIQLMMNAKGLPTAEAYDHGFVFH
jgi:hypothetical protein